MSAISDVNDVRDEKVAGNVPPSRPGVEKQLWDISSSLSFVRDAAQAGMIVRPVSLKFRDMTLVHAPSSGGNVPGLNKFPPISTLVSADKNPSSSGSDDV